MIFEQITVILEGVVDQICKMDLNELQGMEEFGYGIEFNGHALSLSIKYETIVVTVYRKVDLEAVVHAVYYTETRTYANCSICPEAITSHIDRIMNIHPYYKTIR